MRARRGLAVCTILSGVIATLLLLPGALAAQSGGTPSYDVEGYCEQVSQAIGGSYRASSRRAAGVDSSYHGVHRGRP